MTYWHRLRLASLCTLAVLLVVVLLLAARDDPTQPQPRANVTFGF